MWVRKEEGGRRKGEKEALSGTGKVRCGGLLVWKDE